MMEKVRDLPLWGLFFGFGSFLSMLFFAAQGADSTLFGPSVVVSHGVVVADHPAATEVGVEMLLHGGNAVDAAVAAAFAMGVVQPESCGIAGDGFLLVWIAKEGRPYAIDFRARAPSLSVPGMFSMEGPGLPGHWSPPTTLQEQELLRKYSGAAVAVPLALKGLVLALERFGSMSLTEVLRPAIKLAREGFPVRKILYQHMLDVYPWLLGDPEAAGIFLQEGLPPEPGEMLRLPDLADTYERIAQGGIEVFYQGELAWRIAKAVQAAGGILSVEDLATMEPRLREPLSVEYQGYTILTVPPPSSACSVLMALKVLEGIPLSEKRKLTAYYRLFARTFQVVLKYRREYLGDPDFVDVPLKWLLSEELTEKMREEVWREDVGGTSFSSPEGSTTHITVVDPMGNVALLTFSLNSFWGARLIVPGTGILLNNSMADFDPEPGGPNAIAPGKAPLSSMSPTLVLKDGYPYLALGSAGAERILTSVAQVVEQVLEFGAPLEEAILSPRCFPGKEVLELEGGLPAATVAALKASGCQVRLHPSLDLFFGGVNAVQIRREGKRLVLLGVADPRRDGNAGGF